MNATAECSPCYKMIILSPKQYNGYFHAIFSDLTLTGTNNTCATLIAKYNKTQATNCADQSGSDHMLHLLTSRRTNFTSSLNYKKHFISFHSADLPASGGGGRDLLPVCRSLTAHSRQDQQAESQISDYTKIVVNMEHLGEHCQ